MLLNDFSYYSNSTTSEKALLLCDIAKQGLGNCYNKVDQIQPPLKRTNGGFTMLSNIRYKIISQLGIETWIKYNPHDKNNLPDLWHYITQDFYQITSAGDLGLALWAAALKDNQAAQLFLTKLVTQWHSLKNQCNAVELAWALKGLSIIHRNERLNRQARYVLEDVYNQLTALYNPQTSLFAKHSRKGFANSVSRNIACFADQVYPILALSDYSQYFDDESASIMALSTADKICQLQGPQGQWWWHYDTKRGTVSEEYPVFSVHQDAMAPMALFAVDNVTSKDHTAYIEKGLQWLFFQNELKHQIAVPNKIIYRDIHRRELKKFYRYFRGSLNSVGLNTLAKVAQKNISGFKLNPECRPYHLGWILYTWAP